MGNLPETTLKATNGNLGLVPASPGTTQVKIGPCSSGTINLLSPVTTKQGLVDEFTSGPTVDAASLCCDKPGRGPLYVMRAAASTDGVAGSVTKTDAPTAVGNATTVGNVVYTALKAGVRVKMDGGNTKTLGITSITGKDIVIQLGTDGGGAVTSTLTNVRDLLAGDATAALLVTAGSGGGLAATAAFTALSFGGTGSVTVAGTPLDAYQVRVKPSRSGTLNVGAFRYSLDGGDAYSEEITIPAGGTYAIPGTGLTLTFTPGAGAIFFAKDDLFAFDCTAPSCSAGDISSALTALQLETRTFTIIHIVGQVVRADMPAFFAAIKTFADAYEAEGKYVMFVLEGAGNESAESNSTWSAAWIAAMASSASFRMAIALGECEVLAPLLTPQAARTMRRCVSYPMLAHVSALNIATDLGEVLQGPLPGVTKLYHADQADTLAGARFSVAYPINQLEGFYGEGRLFDTSIGDFKYWQDIRVLNEAMRVARIGMLRYQSSAVRVRKRAQGAYPAGSIDPVDAFNVERALNMILSNALTRRGFATEAVLIVDKQINIITEKELPYDVQVTPLGYLKKLTGKAGLKNPALA